MIPLTTITNSSCYELFLSSQVLVETTRSYFRRREPTLVLQYYRLLDLLACPMSHQPPTSRQLMNVINIISIIPHHLNIETHQNLSFHLYSHSLHFRLFYTYTHTYTHLRNLIYTNIHLNHSPLKKHCAAAPSLKCIKLQRTQLEKDETGKKRKTSRPFLLVCRSSCTPFQSVAYPSKSRLSHRE